MPDLRRGSSSRCGEAAVFPKGKSSRQLEVVRSVTAFSCIASEQSQALCLPLARLSGTTDLPLQGLSLSVRTSRQLHGPELRCKRRKMSDPTFRFSENTKREAALLSRASTLMELRTTHGRPPFGS